MAAASPLSLARVILGERMIDGAHLDALDEALIALESGEFDRLAVSMPPQHGKSTTCSLYFPAWYLGRNPTHTLLLLSYGSRYSTGWSRKVRDTLAAYGPDLYGLHVRRDVRSSDRFELTEHGGGVVASGVGGGISGLPANVIVMDDPIKDAEQALSESYRDKVWDWWQSTALARLNPTGKVLVIQTRWHRQDLIGRLMDSEPERWKHLTLRAIAEADDMLGRPEGAALWPEKGYDREWLERERETREAYWWSAQYQQRPSDSAHVMWASRLFEGEDIRFDDWPDGLAYRCMALDPSRGGGSKASDFSAYIMLGLDRSATVWVDCWMRNDVRVDGLVQQGCELIEDFKPRAFGVESVAFQELFQPLFKERFNQQRIRTPIIGLADMTKKQLRIERLDPWLQKRMMRFRRTPGCDRLLSQLREYPMASHDDGPDALEMALRLAGEQLGLDAPR